MRYLAAAAAAHASLSILTQRLKNAKSLVRMACSFSERSTIRSIRGFNQASPRDIYQQGSQWSTSDSENPSIPLENPDCESARHLCVHQFIGIHKIN
jgi:hypothetical protein